MKTFTCAFQIHPIRKEWKNIFKKSLTKQKNNQPTDQTKKATQKNLSRG